jgi:starvation-inducible DNA-binding protein
MAIAIKKATNGANVAPHWHAHAKEIQKYGSVIEDMPHPLDAKVRADMVAKLNQLLADSITLRDMYKKHHWQVTGPTFYQLHLLFDKHFDEQIEMVDTIAERVQLLGGVTIAMGGDVAETTRIRRPPRGGKRSPSRSPGSSRPTRSSSKAASTSPTPPTRLATRAPTTSSSAISSGPTNSSPGS